MVIKGTDIAFYIPPTGIEVIPVSGKGDNYIRDAVTLERLEYAILLNENGEKRYVHGPTVVFPEPNETFVQTPKGGNIFRALELSPISGIYIKVTTDYIDDLGTEYKTGEELFITGNEQAIYYPRPEHSLIQYDGKYMHHAIAIPEGEGRYILNRLTGEIKTIYGPNMYLPDPRSEIVLKRKLSRKECELFYPQNQEVIDYNENLNEKAIEKRSKTEPHINLDTLYCASPQSSTLAIFEAKANISRGTSYTKPRTITLDTKYDGVVSIDVFDGYAVNTVKKNGESKIISGPKTILLDYDETLKTFIDNNKSEVYLKIKDDQIHSNCTVVTKDGISCNLKLTYDINFEEDEQNLWFNIRDYKNYIKREMSKILIKEIGEINFKEFYNNYFNILSKIILNINDNKIDPEKEKNDIKIYKGRHFSKNGTVIYNFSLNNLEIHNDICYDIQASQNKIVKEEILLDQENKLYDIESRIDTLNRMKDQLEAETKKQKLAVKKEIELEELKNEKELAEERKRVSDLRYQIQIEQEENDNKINEIKLARTAAQNEAYFARERNKLELENKASDKYAETTATIMKSITPKLVEALSAKANSEVLETISESIAPYAIAKGESVSDFVNTLLRGTSLENTIKNLHDLTAKSVTFCPNPVEENE